MTVLFIIDSLPRLLMNARRHLGTVTRVLAGVSIVACAITAPAAASDSDGSVVFEQRCIACHGVDGRGVEHLGVTLVGSEFVSSAGVDELAAFLKVGRMPNDPASLNGGVMPGFPYLSDDDLKAVVVHLQTLSR